jgi:cobyrinic acid a,c-diamide synthase
MSQIGFMVAGASSGAGKTTVACGIIGALRRRGMRVRSYKLGPDFIDSGHLARVSDQPCINLDDFLLTPVEAQGTAKGDVLEEEFRRKSGTADALVVEAVGGLFDDWSGDGTSAANIAKRLGLPVILVMPGFASCQTVGIMTNALLTHDPDLTIAGVVYSMVTNDAHLDAILRGVERQHRPRILGYTPYSRDAYLPERHLGLPTVAETPGIDQTAERWADAVERHVTMESLLQLTIPAMPDIGRSVMGRVVDVPSSAPACRVAVARDQAFSFYYAFNLEYLEELGAELVFFSPLSDARLPEDVDALFIGGGFPELHLPALAANEALRSEIRVRAHDGLPVYAECGGLMYLGKEIEDPLTGRWYPTAGLLPIRTRLSDRLHLNYVTARLQSDCLLGPRNGLVKGHVFHRAEVHLVGPTSRAYMASGVGDHLGEEPEGFCYANTLASFVHVHFASIPSAAATFVAHARDYRASKATVALAAHTR